MNNEQCTNIREMKKDEDNIVVAKSMEFAVKTIEICRWLQSNKTEPALTNQLLTSSQENL
ncbi:MAG: hypothetical protein CW341_12575 [Bacteroidetes bacterium]|nr:hypothetical protein [Bacteroidota bacterium]